jgi:hypothetical protein
VAQRLVGSGLGIEDHGGVVLDLVAPGPADHRDVDLLEVGRDRRGGRHEIGADEGHHLVLLDHALGDGQGGGRVPAVVAEDQLDGVAGETAAGIDVGAPSLVGGDDRLDGPADDAAARAQGAEHDGGLGRAGAGLGRRPRPGQSPDRADGGRAPRRIAGHGRGAHRGGGRTPGGGALVRRPHETAADGIGTAPARRPRAGAADGYRTDRLRGVRRRRG